MAINFFNSLAVGTDVLYVDALNDRVGIGTTSPLNDLHVDGNALVTSNATVRGDLRIDKNPSSFPTAKLQFLRNGSTSPAMGELVMSDNPGHAGMYMYARRTISPYTTSYIELPTSVNYDFEINLLGTNALTIDTSSGYTGIGTTNPSEKLEVIGNAILDNNNAKLKIKAGSTGTVGSIDFTFNTDSTQYGLIDLDYDSRASQGLRMKSLYPITLDAVTAQKFLISGSEKMRIDSSGNVGIGTTSVRTKLDINGPLAVIGGTFTSGTSGADSSSDAGIVLRRGKKIFSGIPSSGNQDFYLRNLIEQDTSNTINIGQTGTGLIGNITLNTGSSGNVIFKTKGSESARIDSSGNILIGKTSSSTSTAGVELGGSGYIYATRNNNIPIVANREGTDGVVIAIRNDNSSVGSISVSGSTTSYNTSSDYRLKENVVDMTGALDRIEQLQPKRFNFISDAETIVDGFIAHEVQSVIPEAVFGEKDAVDDEGNPEYQGIDQSKIVPLLVGAIKELKSEIENLKSQINM